MSVYIVYTSAPSAAYTENLFLKIKNKCDEKKNTQVTPQDTIFFNFSYNGI